MDEIFYGGVGLIIAMAQQNYDFVQLTGMEHRRITRHHRSKAFTLFLDKPDRPYDFYKDSNVPEILGSTEVLRKIEIRTNDELKLWPDHAVLVDVSFNPIS